MLGPAATSAAACHFEACAARGDGGDSACACLRGKGHLELLLYQDQQRAVPNAGQRACAIVLVPVRYLFDWSCGAHATALGRIHFAGASIVVMAITDNPYVKAEADYNAGVTNIGRPVVIY